MIRRWTYQTRVRASFVAMVAITATTAAIAVSALRSVVASKDNVISSDAQGLITAARLKGASDRESAGFRGYIAVPEQRFLDERAAAQRDVAQFLNELLRLVRNSQATPLVSEIERAHAALIIKQDRGIDMRAAKSSAEGMTRYFQEEILPERDRLVRAIDAFVSFTERLLEEGKRESTVAASNAGTLVILLAVLAVVFAVATALLLGRALSRQIGSVVQHVQSSSAELQTNANQQASGAKETATAMNEVTTTMSELLATSRQIAESAQQVTRISDETAAAARNGDQTVTKARDAIEGIRRQVNVIVAHMLELGKKSQFIGSVLDIINELAEQTNILSINATIEAAGAGEHGKRFAVVGDEIRKLADRVAGSTKEIRGLVEEIRGAVNTTVLATETGSKSVDAGLHHFEDVARAFKQIADLVVTTTQAAREIELSTKQQTTAVEQVNSAITGAAQASRESETSSSQTLVTATQLARLSHDLSLIVQPQTSA